MKDIDCCPPRPEPTMTRSSPKDDFPRVDNDTDRYSALSSAITEEIVELLLYWLYVVLLYSSIGSKVQVPDYLYHPSLSDRSGKKNMRKHQEQRKEEPYFY